MKERILRTLRQLVDIPGLSGFEQPVVAHLRKAFREVADEVTVDSFGNLYAWRRAGAKASRGAKPSRGSKAEGAGAKPLTLMLAAHSDEVGFIVKAVEPTGFLRFDRVGGTPENMLLGQRVLVNDHRGVIGVKSAHLQQPEERGKPVATQDMYIEVGARDAAEVERMGIHIGDPITFDFPLAEFAGTDRVATKALDDRFGLAVLLELFRDLDGKKVPGDIVAVATVQEEVGLRGATVAAFRVNPDYALAVDTIPSGDTPDVRLTRDHPVAIGRGPVLLLASGGGARGSIIHPAVKSFLLEAADKAGVAYQRALMINYGTTDASAIHLTREGIPAGGIGLPRRFSHSSAETADLNDGVGALRVLKAFIEAMPGHAGRLKFLPD